MNTYLIQSKKFDCEIAFKFNLNGVLSSFDIGATLNLEDTRRITDIIHLLEKEFVAYLTQNKIDFKIISSEISFDKFWDTYDYKDGGSKMKAKQAFDKLSDYDKAAAIDYIKKYKQIKLRQNTAIQYAATYINQRIWNN